MGEVHNEHRLSLEEVHERELKMMKLFIKLCEQYNLRYYMAGGTLLGAVRHKGFIPWDDDIDLLMPRPDYDKLQEIVRKQPLMPRYSFNSSDLGNLNDPMCKIFDLNTRVDKKYIDDPYDRYLWIDIFRWTGSRTMKTRYAVFTVRYLQHVRDSDLSSRRPEQEPIR